jgi:hypothetical protein
VLNFDDSSGKLESDNILVDITGGDPLPAKERDKPHSYGAMLFLDEAGNLVIGDETRDTKEWIAETKAPEQTGNVGGRGSRGLEGGSRYLRKGAERAGRGAADGSLPDGAPRGGR